MEQRNQGYLFGIAGVLVFSGSVPATRAAVIGFDPVFLTAARATIAAALGAVPLLMLRAPRPGRRDMATLALIGACVVIGFPLLSALALGHMLAARGLLFMGLLPLSTASFGVLRGGERPHPAYWAFALAGAGLVAAFALMGGGGQAGIGDLWMIAAVVVCGLGYAEGASLSRRLGGWQVICWALLICAPLMVPLAFITMPATFAEIAPAAWAGLGYVSIFSMLIGFVFWYRGLALGGTASIGQLQLLQPLLGFGLAALLLHEPIGLPLLLSTVGILFCVAGARRFA